MFVRTVDLFNIVYFIISDTTPRNWRVVLGKHDISKKGEPHEVIRDVAKIIVHEHYDPDTVENDITLLKLASPVPMTNYVKPVCLPSFHTAVGESCYATGFGDTMGTSETASLIVEN